MINADKDKRDIKTFKRILDALVNGMEKEFLDKYMVRTGYLLENELAHALSDDYNSDAPTFIYAYSPSKKVYYWFSLEKWGIVLK